MPFLNPWMLLALPLVGVPVLIHLLNRNRSTTINWGAMELLRRVMIVRSRQVRLEDILLMVLRCLIVLLIVLAVARLTTQWAPLAGAPKAGMVVAIDGSLSMTHRPGAASRFEQAVEQARVLLSTVEAGAPVTVVVMGQPSAVLVRHTAYDPIAVDAALNGARPTNAPLDLDANLAEMQPLVGELKAGYRELHLVTDAQTSTFGRFSDKARNALEAITAAGAAVYLAPLGGLDEENCAISDLDLASGVLRAGALAQFHAAVRNHGRRARNIGQVSFMLNDQVVDTRSIGMLEPGQLSSVRFSAMLSRAGINRISARLSGDAMAADDARYAVIDVRQVLRVLCVDGDPEARVEDKAATWVATALSPVGFDRSDVRPLVDTIAWTQLGNASLSDYDTVVLVNVAEVSTDAAMALRDFVAQGGGLVLFPGGNTKPKSLNERFLAPETSLLPAEVIGISGDPAMALSGIPIDVRLPSHPIATPLAAIRQEVLAEIRCYRHLSLKTGVDTRVVINLGSGSPLLMERRVGRGGVLLFASGVEPGWSNMAINPMFPVLMQQAITTLTRQAFETSVLVPRPIVLPTPRVPEQTAVDLTDPTGLATACRTENRGGEVLVVGPATTTAGFHELKAAAMDQAWTVAVNTDTSESDATVLGAPDLALAVEGTAVRILSPDQDLKRAVMTARRGHELWMPLLVAVVGLMAAEALLARRYTKRA